VEKLAAQIIESLREAVVVTDRDRRVVLQNRAARELGVDVAWLVRETKVAHEGVTEVQAADSMGTPRRLAVERSTDGELGIFVIRDVTVGRGFDANAMHDLNNLLGALVSVTSVLRLELPVGGRVSELAAEVQSIVDRAAALVRRALVAARKDREGVRPFDVGAVVREMEPLLRRLVGARVALTVACDEHTGTVVADRVRLEHVVLNLVANARDAMPGGGAIAVSTAAMSPDGSATYAAIRVADTGVGMSADARDHLFEPYFTTKPVGEGNGLGLPSARRFAFDCGGTLSVESEPSHGTTVVLYLPRAE